MIKEGHKVNDLIGKWGIFLCFIEDGEDKVDFATGGYKQKSLCSFLRIVIGHNK